MRKTLVKALLGLGEAHPELMVVTADLGYSVFEPFMAKMPLQYLNVGVAEADMIGISAGLATCGKRPIAYSITPFISIRALEQVRVDVCYHGLPVLLIGTGAGLCYGTLGPTHHGTEDIALMRAMPNMTVLAPCDPYELECLFTQAFELRKPVYMRIGRSTEPEVYSGTKPKIELGKGAVVKEYGKDFAIIACGNMAWTGLQALESLKAQGLQGTLVSMHTVKPLDSALVRQLAGQMPLVSLEEHTLVGGLGSAIAELLADSQTSQKLLRIGLADSFQKKVGTHDYLRRLNGLDPESVGRRIAKFLGP